MTKIIVNFRDELTCLDTDLIAVVQANGNYSHVVFINKREVNLTLGISKMEELLKSKSRKNKFIRISRSIIVNHTFLFRIDLQHQLLVLSDKSGNEIRLNLSKKLIKPYKDAVVESTKIKNNIENTHGKNSIR